MVEHEVCKGCRWNDYPVCLGTKFEDEEFMNIENLRPSFECGQKDRDFIIDMSIKIKTELELKIEDLEVRMIELEK